MPSHHQKAIVNRLREVYHRPATVPLTETGALFKLEVALLKDKVTLTLDTTGPSLFKRAIALKRGAPLKENMATLVMLTNWRKDRPFMIQFVVLERFVLKQRLIGHNIALALIVVLLVKHGIGLIQQFLKST